MCTVNALAITADQFNPDYPESNMFFKVIGLLILGCYFAFTSIYYFASRKTKEFSLSTCVKNFIPVGASSLILFVLGYMDYPMSLDESFCLLCIIALLVSPIYLFATTMFNVIHLLTAKQAEIDDYKTYVKKSLVSITVFFIVSAISFSFVILYGQIL
jgi:hypothetical protein